MKSIPSILRLRKSVEWVRPLGEVPMPPSRLPSEKVKHGHPDINSEFYKKMRAERPDLTDEQFLVEFRKVFGHTRYAQNTVNRSSSQEGWVVRAYSPNYQETLFWHPNLMMNPFITGAFIFDFKENMINFLKNYREELGKKIEREYSVPFTFEVVHIKVEPEPFFHANFIEREDVDESIRIPILDEPDLRFGRIFQIKDVDGQVIYQADVNSLKECVERAVREGSSLSLANLSGANLTGANLYGADLSGANFEGANLEGANLSVANLTGGNLSGANLTRAFLYGANLTGANLSGADLNGANLSGADLLEVDLSGADLSEVDLSWADLRVANLTGADLTGANLTEANLTGTNLKGTILEGKSIYEITGESPKRIPILDEPDLRFGRLYGGFKIIIVRPHSSPYYLTPGNELTINPGDALVNTDISPVLDKARKYVEQTGIDEHSVHIVDVQTSYLDDDMKKWIIKLKAAYDLEGEPVDRPYLPLNSNEYVEEFPKIPILDEPDLRFGRANQRKADYWTNTYVIVSSDGKYYNGSSRYFVDEIERIVSKDTLTGAVEIANKLNRDDIFIVYSNVTAEDSPLGYQHDKWNIKFLKVYNKKGTLINETGEIPSPIRIPILDEPDLRFGQAERYNDWIDGYEIRKKSAPLYFNDPDSWIVELESASDYKLFSEAEEDIKKFEIDPNDVYIVNTRSYPSRVTGTGNWEHKILEVYQYDENTKKWNLINIDLDPVMVKRLPILDEPDLRFGQAGESCWIVRSHGPDGKVYYPVVGRMIWDTYFGYAYLFESFAKAESKAMDIVESAPGTVEVVKVEYEGVFNTDLNAVKKYKWEVRDLSEPHIITNKKIPILDEPDLRFGRIFQIKDVAGQVIYQADVNSLKECVEKAVREGSNLFEAYLTGANLEWANLEGATLYRANLTGGNLTGANLSRVNLSGADLNGATLAEADLTGANLSGANLTGANLEGANLSGANLSGANLSGANLSGANLSEVDLSWADLRVANLTGANLEGGNLSGANLTGANLEGANLSGANLSGANLWKANLSGADLTGANLSVATLWKANLEGANIKGANLKGTILEGKTIYEITGETPKRIPLLDEPDLRFGQYTHTDETYWAVRMKNRPDVYLGTISHSNVPRYRRSLPNNVEIFRDFVFAFEDTTKLLKERWSNHIEGNEPVEAIQVRLDDRKTQWLPVFDIDVDIKIPLLDEPDLRFSHKKEELHASAD